MMQEFVPCSLVVTGKTSQVDFQTPIDNFLVIGLWMVSYAEF